MKDKEQSKAEEWLKENKIYTPISKRECCEIMERYHAEKQRTDDRELLISFADHLSDDLNIAVHNSTIDRFLRGQIPAKEKQEKELKLNKMSKSTSNDKSNLEWIESISGTSKSLKESDKINWFNSCLEFALKDLNAVECKDCGYVCKESDLLNKTGKHSKDEIVCCTKCESKDLKYY